MATTSAGQTMKILVLNPNSSQAMTHGLEEVIKDMEAASQSIEISTYTAPSESPASIDNGNDILQSSEVVYKHLQETGLLKQYDAVLVACFSVHPLVTKLTELQGSLVVTGIFEASILTSLSLLPSPAWRKWGIVTTGKYWEGHLTQGVNTFLGTELESSNTKFAGVGTTGLTAGDFHGGVAPEVIQEKLREATRRLLAKGDVSCVVMGCAGMAGLEDIIRSVAVEEYGVEKGNQLLVIDGVRAGIGLLEQMVRNKRAFQKR